jgi:hypothetical protein
MRNIPKMLNRIEVIWIGRSQIWKRCFSDRCHSVISVIVCQYCPVRCDFAHVPFAYTGLHAIGVKDAIVGDLSLRSNACLLSCTPLLRDVLKGNMGEQRHSSFHAHSGILSIIKAICFYLRSVYLASASFDQTVSQRFKQTEPFCDGKPEKRARSQIQHL